MTREDARKAAEVMMAFAEGKELEFCIEGKTPWEKCSAPFFDWDNYKYRIKKEFTYRPFKNAKECWAEMQKHQPFGWVKRKEKQIYEICCIVDSNGVDGISFDGIYRDYTFADGTPFGIKDE